jgi:hypothetical protein
VLNLTAPRATRTLIPGTRKINRIVLDASPGNGKGTVPANCTDTSVRAINGIGANGYNNFNLDAEGCVRIKRPVTLTSLEPREFDYATVVDRATLAFNNNCKNCCDCESFARTYQGIKRQWFLYRNVADLATNTRDRYEDNRARWLEQKAAREQDKLRLRLSPGGKNKISWGLSFCNTSKCCISGINVYFFWYGYLDDESKGPGTLGSKLCNPTLISGADACAGTTAIFPQTFNATQEDLLLFSWNRSDPQTTTTISGRHHFPLAEGLAKGRLKIRLFVLVSWLWEVNSPVTGDPCDFNSVLTTDLPVEIQNAIAAAELTPGTIYSTAASDYVIVDPTNPYCFNCNT